jgi:hypothetical protein
LRIKNYDELVAHGNRDARKTVLAMLEAGLAASDPYENTKKMLRVDEGNLIIGHKDFDVQGLGPIVIDLSEIEHIWVLGAAKAVQRMAKGLEDVLGDRITGGAVTAKKGEGKYLERIEVTLGSHPTPDEDSVKGAWRQVEVARKVGKNDLLFRLVSGGGSSLNVIPDPSLTLDDLIAVTNAVYSPSTSNAGRRSRIRTSFGGSSGETRKSRFGPNTSSRSRRLSFGQVSGSRPPISTLPIEKPSFDDTHRWMPSGC